MNDSLETAILEHAAAIRDLAAAIREHKARRSRAPQSAPVGAGEPADADEERHLPRFELLVESADAVRWRNGKGAWWSAMLGEQRVSLGAANNVVTNLRAGTRLTVAGRMEEKSGKTIVWASKIDSREDPEF